MSLTDSLVALGYRHGVRGTERLAKRVYGSRVVRSITTDVEGLRWQADPLDWMDQQILIHGSYEPEITSHLCEVLRAGDVLWDVGANSGVHALAVEAAMPSVEVLAFEPSPAHYARLQHNAQANGLEVRAYCVALGDRRGYQDFSVADTGNSGHSSLASRPGTVYTTTFPCWCDTADDLVASGVSAPTVLKLDVEDGVDAAIRGMRGVLSGKALRHMVVEAEEGAEALLALKAARMTVHRIASTGGGSRLVRQALRMAVLLTVEEPPGQGADCNPASRARVLTGADAMASNVADGDTLMLV
jgi:FkbM family methyltransferase